MAHETAKKEWKVRRSPINATDICRWVDDIEPMNPLAQFDTPISTRCRNMSAPLPTAERDRDRRYHPGGNGMPRRSVVIEWPDADKRAAATTKVNSRSGRVHPNNRITTQRIGFNGPAAIGRSFRPNLLRMDSPIVLRLFIRGWINSITRSRLGRLHIHVR